MMLAVLAKVQRWLTQLGPRSAVLGLWCQARQLRDDLEFPSYRTTSRAHSVALAVRWIGGPILGLAAVMLTAVFVIGLWTLLTPPDWSVTDTLMNAPALTFFSADIDPPRAPNAPEDGSATYACARNSATAEPIADAVIGQRGASRPDAFDMIGCAREELARTRTAPGAPGPAWGSSRNVIDALVAQEDRDFWKPGGVNLIGMIKGGLKFIGGHGASTLRMQTFKNLFFYSRKGNLFDRKLHEALYADRLERALRTRLAHQADAASGALPLTDVKARVMSLYLQVAAADADFACPFDQQQMADNIAKPENHCIDKLGLGLLARRAYGKRLDQLTIAEAVSVAAWVKGPSFSPLDPMNLTEGDCSALWKARTAYMAARDPGQALTHAQQLTAAVSASRRALEAIKTNDDSQTVPPSDQFRSLADRIHELKWGAPYPFNRCRAEHTLAVMANQHAPASSLLDRIAEWFGRYTPLQIPTDQISAQAPLPLITPVQAKQAKVELGQLAVCTMSGNPQLGRARTERGLWCDMGEQTDDLVALRRKHVEADDFINWVRKAITLEGAPDHANIDVYTTLEPNAQRVAIDTLRKAGLNFTRALEDKAPPALPQDNPRPTGGALVTLSQDGEVKALAGAAAVQSGALPGSTLKPFIFAARLATELQSRPAMTLADLKAAFHAPKWLNNCGLPSVDPRTRPADWPNAAPGECGYTPTAPSPWLPRNDQNEVGAEGGCQKEHARDPLGKASLFEALCRSQNTVTAEVAYSIGKAPIADVLGKALWDRSGKPFFDPLHHPMAYADWPPDVKAPQQWPLTVIGEGGETIRPITLAAGYLVFLNQGNSIMPRGWRVMLVPSQTRGKPATMIYVPQASRPRVIDPKIVEVLREGLHSVVADRGGTAYAAHLPSGFAGKTGTTDIPPDLSYPRNIWFVGYGPVENKPEVTALWLAFGRRTPRKVPLSSAEAKVRHLFGAHNAELVNDYIKRRLAMSPQGAP